MIRPTINNKHRLALLPVFLFSTFALGVVEVSSADNPKKKEMAAKQEMAAPVDNADGGYCSNILDAASEARAAFRLKKLKDIEAEIEKRIAALEEKSQEIKSWLERREKFIDKAQGQLVAIYKQMRPDAAALQLAVLDEMTAAAILLKLKPRTASSILNEMDPKLAARLASFVSYAAKKAAKKGQS